MVVDSVDHFLSDLIETEEHLIKLLLSVRLLLVVQLIQVILETLTGQLDFLTTELLDTRDDVHLWDLSVLFVILNVVVDAVGTKRLIAVFETAEIRYLFL